MAAYIRVEAINIYRSVLDTQQLSVIRGSSLLLRQAMKDIEEGCAGRLEALSTGASSGLFRVAAADGEQAAAGIARDIAAWLNGAGHEGPCGASGSSTGGR